MKSKHWFLASAALILMIVVAPWYMKAQALSEQDLLLEEIGRLTSENSEIASKPTLKLDIGANRQWRAGDGMSIKWLIENASYPTSTMFYVGVIKADASTSTNAMIINNKSIGVTPSPLFWKIPADLGTGEYSLGGYITGTSTTPLLVSNQVVFKVTASIPSTSPTTTARTLPVPIKPVTEASKEAKKIEYINKVTVSPMQPTTNATTLNLSALEKRILELEKTVALLKQQLNKLSGSSDVEKQPLSDQATTETTEPELGKMPVAWSEEYLNMTDSDKDGLPDKVEAVVGTDADNPDSDGDGYADGLEIKSNFNPLTSGKLNAKSGLKAEWEGKIISTSNADGQQEKWLIKDGKKIYIGEASS